MQTKCKSEILSFENDTEQFFVDAQYLSNGSFRVEWLAISRASERFVNVSDYTITRPCGERLKPTPYKKYDALILWPEGKQ